MKTVKEIAQDLKISTRTVRRWIKTGQLRAAKIQGIVRVSDEDYNKLKRGSR